MRDVSRLIDRLIFLLIYLPPWPVLAVLRQTYSPRLKSASLILRILKRLYVHEFVSGGFRLATWVIVIHFRLKECSLVAFSKCLDQKERRFRQERLIRMNQPYELQCPSSRFESYSPSLLRAGPWNPRTIPRCSWRGWSTIGYQPGSPNKLQVLQTSGGSSSGSMSFFRISTNVG